MNKPLWQQILDDLERGRTFSEYPTGQYGYEEMYRWDDTHEVIPLKSVLALTRRGLITFQDIPKSETVIPC